MRFYRLPIPKHYYRACTNALPAVIRALDHLIEDTNKLFDQSNYRICRLTLGKCKDVQHYGVEVVDCLVKDENRMELQG